MHWTVRSMRTGSLGFVQPMANVILSSYHKTKPVPSA